MKVAAISTHPIQYQAPWFRALSALEDINLRVYYGLIPDEHQQGLGFEVPFQWDLPLLEGYHWEALPSDRRSPNLAGFFGNSTRKVYSKLRAARPDALIVTGWNALPLIEATVAARMLGIPTLVRGDSN